MGVIYNYQIVIHDKSFKYFLFVLQIVDAEDHSFLDIISSFSFYDSSLLFFLKPFYLLC